MPTRNRHESGDVLVYIEFLKKAFQKQYAYRANTYIRMFGALVGVFISINIWLALYGDTGAVNGISLPDMIDYVILNALIISLSSCSIGTFIANKVKDGSIIVDFIRPVNFKYYVFSEQIGSNLYQFVFSSIVPVAAVALVYGFRLPSDPLLLVCAIVAMLLGIALNFQIEYLMGLLSFWFKTSFYVDWILRACWTLFAGAAVPLWFYPDFLYRLSSYLPFRFISFEPIALFLGKVAPGREWGVLAFQTVWIAALVLIERFMWSRIQRRIVIHGG